MFGQLLAGVFLDEVTGPVYEGVVDALRAPHVVPLSASSTPMLVAFGDSDPITGPMADIFKHDMRGAQGIDHPVIAGGGHFLQEDAGEELAKHVVDFLR